ncbi:hypothetical protein KO481_25725 [Nocardia sp. NEAU-G5]|uniref:PE domain-containing protein n=1 Tax=Nocardia albiluteola TaxID=2842303 RepID=A0ABS6B3N7_9NOCA|nr:type VII secretion target [Nocardia albiluteola]MBU3064917.1 hypothetical protein [Nocardia albiluteola]
MNEVVVIPGAFRAHGDLNATQAGLVTTAGTVDQVAAIQAATAVFGPIAADFLAAFAVAQANHARAVAELAQVHTATAAAAQAAAANYESTDADSAAGFEGLAPIEGVLSSVLGTAASPAEAAPAAELGTDAIPNVPQASALPAAALPQDSDADPRYRSELGNNARAAEAARPGVASADPVPSKAVPVAATAQREVVHPVPRAAVAESTRAEAL